MLLILNIDLKAFLNILMVRLLSTDLQEMTRIKIVLCGMIVQMPLWIN